MRWGRLSTGLILAAMSGVTFGHAWTIEQARWWWVGSMTLLAAVLFILSAMYQEPGRMEIARPVPGGRPRNLGSAAPLLGQMLLQRAMITRQDLDRALALQKGSSQRLGEVLVGMELLTHADLAEVLEEQLAERDEGLVWR